MNVGDKYEVMKNQMGLIELKRLPLDEPTPEPEPEPEPTPDPEPEPVADIVITGDQGYKRFYRSGLEPGTTIDLSQATFILDNIPETPEEQRVPIFIENSPHVVIKGGRVDGFVNLTGEHGATYHDASAIRILNCPGFIFENFRGDKLWDGIRFRMNCEDFTLRNFHLSNCRDDMLENDYQHGGLVENCLLEDGLSMMALDPPSSSSGVDGSANKVIFKNVVSKLQMYNQSGEMTHGAVFKCSDDDTNPVTEHFDCVYAIEDPSHNGMSRHRRWAQKARGYGDCFFLNLSDKPLSSTYARAEGFIIMQGAEAREKYNAVRTAWLNSNPSLK